jgi:hypothetical protein
MWYVHCPRCGVFSLERIAARHVTEGSLHIVKRFLGFSAYRCDPCRTRFFSVRQYREILPLGSAARKRRSQDFVAAGNPQS